MESLSASQRGITSNTQNVQSTTNNASNASQQILQQQGSPHVGPSQPPQVGFGQHAVAVQKRTHLGPSLNGGVSTQNNGSTSPSSDVADYRGTTVGVEQELTGYKMQIKDDKRGSIGWVSRNGVQLVELTTDMGESPQAPASAESVM